MTSLYVRKGGAWHQQLFVVGAGAAQTLFNGWDTSSTVVPSVVTSAAMNAVGRVAYVGVPPFITPTLHSGDYHTSKVNEVIDSLDIRGTVFFDHSGAFMKNCVADGWTVAPNTSPIIVACEFDGGLRYATLDSNWRPRAQAGYWSGSGDRTLCGFNMYRCNVWGSADAQKVHGGCKSYNCYFHDGSYDVDSTQSSGDTHNDVGMQVQCGDANTMKSCIVDGWTFAPRIYNEVLTNGQGPHIGDNTHDWDSGTSPLLPAALQVGTYHGKSTSCILMNCPTTFPICTNTLIDDNIFDGLAVKYIHFINTNGGGGHRITNNKFGDAARDDPQWLAGDHNSPYLAVPMSSAGNTRLNGTAIS